MPFRVAVIGGTGAFGERVCRLLARHDEVVPIVLARNRQRAKALAGELCKLHGRHDIQAAELNLGIPGWVEVLASLQPDAVIHTAGPFQGADYRVAEACIGLKAHYVDLADARAFVSGIERLDPAARAAGVLVTSGASSVPALSAAVIDDMATHLSRIDAIDIAISPGNRAPRGTATVAAILSYVGRPVRLWRAGKWTHAVGWQDLHARALALPDGTRLGRRWFGLCEVPDLDLFPERYAVGQRVAFYAGLELPLLHFGLWLLSWLVRWGWLRSLTPLAGILHWMASVVRGLGTDRGGMLVDVAGQDAGGRAVIRRWRLLAESGDGPWIPALASVALVRKLARGAVAARGAMPCTGLLQLEEIRAEAEGMAIRCASEEVRPLYVQCLGPAYGRLPLPIAQLHDVAGGAAWHGRADVDGPKALLAWLAARSLGLPAPARDVAVTVEFEVRDGIETWRRTFAEREFASTQYAGSGGERGLIVERFAFLCFAMDAVGSSDGIDLELRSGRLLGIPLPRFLLPRIVARERVDDLGRFRFDVDIGVPGIGRLVHYRGWLEPAEATSRAAAE